ncbi:MAG: class I SAM-dependent methyltransferase [Haloarculaceae archaeon]
MDPDETRRQWAERSGEFSPAYYAYYGSNEASELVLAALDRYLDREARVLELGCSSGRHLAHLHEHGFEDLAGIELNEDALDVMASTYPDLAAEGTFYFAAMEDVVGDFEDGSFDAVFSVQTLQHVHPEAAWVFEEIARVTDDLLVTVENEGARGGGDRTQGRTDGASRGSGAGDAPDSAGPAVNYVNDEFPLYYRDWGRVFTGLGLVEVETGTDGRDTVRVFRSGTPASRV